MTYHIIITVLIDSWSLLIYSNDNNTLTPFSNRAAMQLLHQELLTSTVCDIQLHPITMLQVCTSSLEAEVQPYRGGGTGCFSLPPTSTLPIHTYLHVYMKITAVILIHSLLTVVHNYNYIALLQCANAQTLVTLQHWLERQTDNNITAQTAHVSSSNHSFQW